MDGSPYFAAWTVITHESLRCQAPQSMSGSSIVYVATTDYHQWQWLQSPLKARHQRHAQAVALKVGWWANDCIPFRMICTAVPIASQSAQSCWQCGVLRAAVSPLSAAVSPFECSCTPLLSAAVSPRGVQLLASRALTCTASVRLIWPLSPGSALARHQIALQPLCAKDVPSRPFRGRGRLMIGAVAVDGSP